MIFDGTKKRSEDGKELNTLVASAVAKTLKIKKRKRRMVNKTQITGRDRDFGATPNDYTAATGGQVYPIFLQKAL